MTEAETKETKNLQLYQLDRYAHQLVLDYRDKKNVLNESHKMRMAIAYGLERFWGEHLRFERERSEESRNKGSYWKAVWVTLAEILHAAEIELPDKEGNVTLHQTREIEETVNAIWDMSPKNRRIALMVLTQLCDALVWWTQRYKKPGEGE
ncbi:MAG: hypothetical protein WBV73_00650 [Phormidium sp.]